MSKNYLCIGEIDSYSPDSKNPTKEDFDLASKILEELEDLKNKYDIEISELDSEQEETFDGGAVQMTLFEIIPFPVQPTPLKAA